jgi:hypothetical protein
MAEDWIREIRGDGADIEARTRKAPGSAIGNGTRQPGNISSKNGAMFVSIARRNAHAKSSGSHVDAPSVRMQPAIVIPHRRTIAFDNGADPHSGNLPEDPAHTQSDPDRNRKLCKSGETEEECLVIDRETNATPPQFGVRIAGLQ